MIVGVGDFGRTEPVPARDVEQRVALANRVDLQRTDQIVTAGRNRVSDQRAVFEVVLAPAMGEPRRREQRRHGENHRRRAYSANPRRQPRSFVMHSYAPRAPIARHPPHPTTCKKDMATPLTPQSALDLRTSAPAILT